MNRDMHRYKVKGKKQVAFTIKHGKRLIYALVVAFAFLLLTFNFSGAAFCLFTFNF